MRMGLNDARCIVQAIGTYIFIIFFAYFDTTYQQYIMFYCIRSMMMKTDGLDDEHVWSPCCLLVCLSSIIFFLLGLTDIDQQTTDQESTSRKPAPPTVTLNTVTVCPLFHHTITIMTRQQTQPPSRHVPQPFERRRQPLITAAKAKTAGLETCSL